MSDKDTGGPVFLLYCGPGDGQNSSGISARDYFAAKAMQSLITGRSWDHVPVADIPPMWAKGAYEVADAMLAERAK